MNARLADALTLIAITDDLRDGVDGLAGRAAAAVRGGATMVQVRLKHETARTIAAVVRECVARLPVPVVVNDRADVAIAAGAAGVHVGADDLPVAAVRRVAPQEFLIGASFGSEAEASVAAGADYVGIGPVFGTATKPDAGAPIGADGLARLRALAAVPTVGIGGVHAGNVREVIATGVRGVAVIAGIFGSADPEAAARAIRAAMRT